MPETRHYSPDALSEPTFFFTPEKGEPVPARIAHTHERQPRTPELGEIETAALTAEARDAAAVNQADNQASHPEHDITMETGEIVAQLMYIGGLVELNRAAVLDASNEEFAVAA